MRSILALLVLFLLSLLIVVPPVQAASRDQQPHHLTPDQIQALRQHLKKAIHVTHTGKKRVATKTTSSPLLRPRASNLPAYNNTGISDATTRNTASFDTANRSYSASVLQDAGLVPGITVTSQNVTYIWPSVPAGQPDNYQVAGQVIPLSGAQGASILGFLGASTYGNSSGTATITYTDGSTTTFTLSLTDWWNGTAMSGNQQVAHLTTINTKHGTQSGDFYLYATTTALDPTKTVQSVTLPATSSPGQIHVFAVGVGGPAFNNAGISDNSNPGAASFDGSSSDYSYSAQSLASADLVPGQQFDLDGIAYTWPSAASGAVDNYVANGQVLPIIPVPNATTLGFLGAATNGPSAGTATLTYTDGSTQSFTLAFNDWWGASQYSNLVAASFSSINQPGGQRTGGTFYLYATEVSLQAGKTLQSVTLPSSVNQGLLHVFAIGTRAGLNNLGTSNNSQPGAGNYDGAGRSWSIQALEAANIRPGQPVVFNGVSFTWPASYGSLADNNQAAGQVIPVTPVAGATAVAFLGSATNGNSSGTATLTYTDGSTQTFTLGLTDWWNTTPQYGNKAVASFTTINIPGGTRSGTYALYYAETSLQPGKILQSVTLPATASPGQLHIFAIGTRSAYTNIGISDDSNPAGANFDGGGSSYSEEDFENPNVAGWNPGDTLTYEGINFVWPNVPAGQGDNYAAAGQVIPVTPVAGATTIGFVGAVSIGGTAGSSGTATLTYTDGSTSTFTLAFSDWTLDGGLATPLASNRLFALLPHRNTPQGQQNTTTYLFYLETSLQAGKTLQSVTLPSSLNQGSPHVFMIGTRAGENYPNNVGTSNDGDTLFANYDGGGASYSIEALEAAGVQPGQPFTFNGVTFSWPASYSVVPDNYQVAGQVVPITPVAGATTLAFLGSATNGPSSGTATLTYTDGSTQTFTLGFADWTVSSVTSLPYGDQVAATMTYRNTASGQQTITTYLFFMSVTLQTGKTLQSITLPSSVSQGHLHVFAIGTK